jgi:hypothetical protein
VLAVVPFLRPGENDLMVEEISMAKPVAPSQALVATTLHPPDVESAPSGLAPMQQPKKKNKNKKTSGPTWPSFYNLWTGLIQMWPGAPRGPLPGSCPLDPQQHRGPAPVFQHGPPRPQQAFLGGPVGPAFGGSDIHGGLLSVPPGFLPGPTLPDVPEPPSFGRALPGLPALPPWLP